MVSGVGGSSGSTTGIFFLLNIWLVLSVPLLALLYNTAVVIAERPQEHGAYKRRFKTAYGFVSAIPRGLFRCLRVGAEAVMMGAKCQGPISIIKMTNIRSATKAVFTMSVIILTGVLGYYTVTIFSLAANSQGTVAELGNQTSIDTTLQQATASLSPSQRFGMIHLYLILAVPFVAYALHSLFNPSTNGESGEDEGSKISWKSIISLPLKLRSYIPDWVFDTVFVIGVIIPYIGMIFCSSWLLRQATAHFGEISGLQVIIAANMFFLLSTPLLMMAIMKVEVLVRRVLRGVKG